MFWYSNHMNGWGWVLMIFAMVAFWSLLIAVIFPIRPWGSRPGSPAQVPAPSTPEQLLAGRFARGDIDEPEYAGRLTALRESHRS